MNSKKNSKLDQLVRFMGNKGFYIVLFLCVAVIGISAWVLTYTLNKTGLDYDEDLSMRVTAALPTPSALEVPTLNPNEINPPATSAPESENNQTGSQISENNLDLEAGNYVDSFDSGGVSQSDSHAGEDAMNVSETDIAPTAYVWPLAGNIIMPHSIEALVYDKTMADWRTHSGIDISGDLGAKVISAASGTVEDVYKDQMMGTTVVIYHGGGLRSIYSNLADTPAVSIGDIVAMGDVVGAIGQTALAESGIVSHLHFEMTVDNEDVDPNSYLPAL